jgi:putative ABC transport system permease protein
MTFARTGDVRLPVVAVVEPADARALSTDFLLSHATYEAHFSERVDASVLVRTADGVDAAAARDAIERAVADYPAAQVRDQGAAVAGRAATVDQVLALVTVLVAFATLIALLGITNTLVLSVVERTREIGLLRAVGMSRAQVRSMVRTEAVLLAAVGAVVGLGAGAAVAAGAVGTLGTPAAVSVPVLPLLAVAAVATAAGAVAGMVPARRAARLDVLAAVARG